NAFKVQWERFLLHVATDAPFPHDFCEGAKGVQLAELALQSWHERRWIDVPALDTSPPRDVGAQHAAPLHYEWRDAPDNPSPASRRPPRALRDARPGGVESSRGADPQPRGL